jgi:hypothetical protein
VGRVTTNLIATATLALLAATACRDAAAPVQGPADPTGSLIGDLLTGNIAVRTTTTGSSPDPDGYTVTVDLLSSKWTPTNGGVTFTVLTGAHTVALSGVAPNCRVTSGSTSVVTVLLGGTVSANFSVSCAPTGPTTGNLTVTAATTGAAADLDPDGYTVTVNGGNTRTIPVNGSTTYTEVPPGSYSVALNGVAGNCAVSGANPRTVTVTAGGTTGTNFAVSCTGTSPPTTSTRVTGRGAMGSGTATPGSDRQEFDFEATSAPSGRAAVTDYSVVRPSGTVGHMIVDQSVDPATGVTSFTRTSTTCVRFEGMGRLDTGELMRFFIDACDNASPGAGFDTFTVTLPDRGGPGVAFIRSGTVTEGDIAISTF